MVTRWWRLTAAFTLRHHRKPSPSSSSSSPPSSSSGPTQTNNRFQSVSARRVVAAQWLLSVSLSSSGSTRSPFVCGLEKTELFVCCCALCVFLCRLCLATGYLAWWRRTHGIILDLRTRRTESKRKGSPIHAIGERSTAESPVGRHQCD